MVRLTVSDVAPAGVLRTRSTVIQPVRPADGAEPAFRAWYDTFERALADHAGTPDVRARAGDTVTAFHDFLQAAIDAERRGRGRPGLLAETLARPDGERLADDEIRRNALIIFFGGISTGEAVILNTLWALLTHPPALARVRAQRDLLDAAFDETRRWMAPVQSASRKLRSWRYSTASMSDTGPVAMGAGRSLIICSRERSGGRGT